MEDALGEAYVLKVMYELDWAFELAATYCLASTLEDETIEVEDEEEVGETTEVEDGEGDDATGVFFA